MLSGSVNRPRFTGAKDFMVFVWAVWDIKMPKRITGQTLST